MLAKSVLDSDILSLKSNQACSSLAGTPPRDSRYQRAVLPIQETYAGDFSLSAARGRTSKAQEQSAKRKNNRFLSFICFLCLHASWHRRLDSLLDLIIRSAKLAERSQAYERNLKRADIILRMEKIAIDEATSKLLDELTEMSSRHRSRAALSSIRRCAVCVKPNAGVKRRQGRRSVSQTLQTSRRKHVCSSRSKRAREARRNLSDTRTDCRRGAKPVVSV